MAVKLSTTLIIVIAVSSLVGCVLILFLFFKCCRRPESAPLPPIQPLAHEKESSYLSRPRSFRNSLVVNQFGIHESDTALLKPSGKPSFQTDGSEGTPSSSHNSFLNPASPPNLTPTPTPRSTDEEQPQQYIPTSRQARPVSRALRRSRVISVASTNSIFTQASPRPTSIIRGAPHSALSNVQIVLPAPLAPRLQSHMVVSSSVSRRSNSESDFLAQGRMSSISGIRYSRSLETTDQARGSQSQPQLRERSVPDSLPPPPSDADIAPPVPSIEGQAEPHKATTRDCLGG